MLELGLNGIAVDLNDALSKTAEFTPFNPPGLMAGTEGTLNGGDLLGETFSGGGGRDPRDDTGSSAPPSTPSSPDLLSPASHSVTSPESLFSDPCTQLSLAERSEGLTLADEISTVDSNTFWSMVTDDAASHPDSASRKSLKASQHDAPGSSGATSPAAAQATSPRLMFEAGAAVCSSNFVFTKFGSDVPGTFTFGSPSNGAETSTSSILSGAR